MTPWRRLVTAGPTSCTPVAMITAVSGASWRIWLASQSPSCPGMRMSHKRDRRRLVVHAIERLVGRRGAHRIAAAGQPAGHQLTDAGLVVTTRTDGREGRLGMVVQRASRARAGARGGRRRRASARRRQALTARASDRGAG